MELTTNSLMNRIIKGKDIREVLDDNLEEFEEQPISSYLGELCIKHDKVPEHVIKKAHIDRTYGHQIFNGTRIPSRDKLIQLAFGFELSLDEVQELLKISGKSTLYARIKRDAVCIYAISHDMSIMEVQELLLSLELPVLGDV